MSCEINQASLLSRRLQSAFVLCYVKCCLLIYVVSLILCLFIFRPGATAIDALKRGYETIFVIDSVKGIDPANSARVVETIVKNGGLLQTCSQILQDFEAYHARDL